MKLGALVGVNHDFGFRVNHAHGRLRWAPNLRTPNCSSLDLLVLKRATLNPKPLYTIILKYSRIYPSIPYYTIIYPSVPYYYRQQRRKGALITIIHGSSPIMLPTLPASTPLRTSNLCSLEMFYTLPADEELLGQP